MIKLTVPPDLLISLKEKAKKQSRSLDEVLADHMRGKTFYDAGLTVEVLRSERGESCQLTEPHQTKA